MPSSVCDGRPALLALNNKSKRQPSETRQRFSFSTRFSAVITSSLICHLLPNSDIWHWQAIKIRLIKFVEKCYTPPLTLLSGYFFDI
jgi:hypothetical protein